MRPVSHPRSRQQGAVLVVSLIFLFILTLLGVGSMDIVTIEEKMSSNLRDGNLAFQAAESALREGESWISSQVTNPPQNCDADSCEMWALNSLNNGQFIGQTDGWWQSKGRVSTSTFAEINSNPHFIVEDHSFQADSLKNGTGNSSGIHYYRITARGTGGTGDAQAIVQSIYSRRY